VSRVPIPEYQPQLALLVKEPPAGDDWLHEMKFDGFRIGCRIDRGAVTLLSRRRKDWTAAFPPIAAAAARLKVQAALLDGEAAAVLPDGRTSLLAMHGDGSGSDSSSRIAYFAFDILHLDGEDLTGLPTERRKEVLRQVLGATPPRPLTYVDHVVGQGAAFFREAERMRLEGIVSKARAAPYRPGARNATWQKTKCVLRQEFVIGGWDRSVRGGLGALFLGYYDEEGRLVHAGKVGTGFQRQEKELLARLTREKTRDASPFDVGTPKGAAARDAHWIEPRIVAEVAFLEWTEGGHIRHPSFQGLRDDKDPREVRAEHPRPPPST
jgi:bifunctional non-homologous end joining protein LigD